MSAQINPESRSVTYRIEAMESVECRFNDIEKTIQEDSSVSDDVARAVIHKQRNYKMYAQRLNKLRVELHTAEQTVERLRTELNEAKRIGLMGNTDQPKKGIVSRFLTWLFL